MFGHEAPPPLKAQWIGEETAVPLGFFAAQPWVTGGAEGKTQRKPPPRGWLRIKVWSDRSSPANVGLLNPIRPDEVFQGCQDLSKEKDSEEKVQNFRVAPILNHEAEQASWLRHHAKTKDQDQKQLVASAATTAAAELRALSFSLANIRNYNATVILANHTEPYRARAPYLFENTGPDGQTLARQEPVWLMGL
ncbi:hypothetical protein [Paenibacillus sp. FSL L8-0463]|uniref:hypothetical protein n=1 Tax=Paenibacillus sp. FSL L8-0463 TaxID=2954687 RepID=UPI003119765C